jgi:hypothetical protein
MIKTNTDDATLPSFLKKITTKSSFFQTYKNKLVYINFYN